MVAKEPLETSSIETYVFMVTRLGDCHLNGRKKITCSGDITRFNVVAWPYCLTMQIRNILRC